MNYTPFALLALCAAMPTQAATIAEAEKLLTLPIEAQTAAAPADDSRADKEVATDCLLTPSLDVMVASPVVGVIDSIQVQRGDYVKKGDVLVKLRSEVEQATLKLNRAQAEYGQRTIRRNTELYQRNLISEQEKDEIIINNRLYGYEMEQTKAQLAQKTIYSPLTGVVVEKLLDPGEYVGEDPILQVVQLDPLYVEAVVPAKYYGRIVQGSKANVTLDTPTNNYFETTVKIVDKVLDAASGTFGVRMQLSNPNYQLPAGLKCSVAFNLVDKQS
jgi:RND family efflux transporter MFP subunit